MSFCLIFFCLYNTVLINRQKTIYNGAKIYKGTQTKIYEKSSRRNDCQAYHKHDDSDLLDMHYFLTEDDDLDDDEFEEGFYIF